MSKRKLKDRLSESLKIVFLVLQLFIHDANTSLITLHGRYHFYELITSTNASAFTKHEISQPFNDIIIGNGTCLNLLPSSQLANFSTSFDSFRARPIVYSNEDQTLSFLLEISFSALDWHPNKIRGYQISFEIATKSKSCLQIISRPGKEPTKSFRLRIKDPSFVSIYSTNYTFYFGRVQVQGLVDCQPSNKRDAEHASHQDTSLNGLFKSSGSLCLDPNTASQSIEVGIEKAKQIDVSKPILTNDCIIDLNDYLCVKKLTNLTFAVFHPMPSLFNHVLSTLFPDSQNEDAKIPRYRLFRERIDSFRSQAYPNNIVFKLVDYVGAEMLPVALLLDPTQNNLCRNYVDQCYQNASNTCESHDPNKIQCTQCYSTMENGNFNNAAGIRYQNIKNEFSSPGFVSEYCRKVPEFAAYDFSNVEIETEFRNSKLNEARMLENKSVSKSYARNDLPRFCLRRSTRDDKFRIYFNDVFKTAQTSLFENTEYDFKLMNYTYSKKNATSGLYKIKTKELLHRRLTDLVESEDILLKEGHYLIELTPRMDNSLCASSSKCIAESNKNNEFECVTCDKVFARFSLKHVTFEQIMNDPKKSYRNINTENICSFDSLSFGLILEQSHMHEHSIWNRLSHSAASPNPVVFESGLLPIGFDMENLLLDDNEIYIYYYTKKTDSILLIFVSVMGLLLFVFLLVVINLIFIYFKSNFGYRSQRRTVLIYLSVFVSRQTQNELRIIMENYKRCINRYFGNINIEIVDYRTDSFQRDRLLRSSQQIVYILGSNAEYAFAHSLKIGTHSFNHDYDRLRLIDRYRAKCVSVSLNQVQRETLYESKQSSTSRCCFSSSSNQEVLPMLPSNDVFHFPSDTKRLLSLITNVTGHIGISSPKRRFYKLRSFLKIMPIKILLFRLESLLMKRLKLNIDRYNANQPEFINIYNNDDLREQIIFEYVE